MALSDEKVRAFQAAARKGQSLLHMISDGVSPTDAGVIFGQEMEERSAQRQRELAEKLGAAYNKEHHAQAAQKFAKNFSGLTLLGPENDQTVLTEVVPFLEPDHNSVIPFLLVYVKKSEQQANTKITTVPKKFRGYTTIVLSETRDL
jgi:hypothetical protein